VPRSAAALVLSFLLLSAATPRDRPEKCESTKLGAAGNLYKCRLTAEAKAVIKEAAPTGFDKCAASQAKKWGKADAAGGCPVSGDEAAVLATVEAMTDVAVAALIPAPPASNDARKCGASKLKASAKYGACRLKAHSKNVKAGTPLDFAKCDGKLTTAFAKADAKGGAECPASPDVEVMRTQTTADADAIALQISGVGPTTTTTTTTLPPAPPPGSIGSLIYSEDFTGSDASSWPAPWTAIGGVETADLLGGRARFRPLITSYSLARMFMPATETNTDVLLTAEWGDFATQGMGFYVRQNGGYLQDTVTHGQGYAVFVEGFRGDGVGVWKEIDGNEIDLSINFGLPLDIMSNVPYRIRFRAYQVDAGSTRLLARVWPEGSPEPTTWDRDFTDAEPLLQGVSGGFTLDAYSSLQAGPPDAFQFVDDLEIRVFENPLLGIGAVTLVDETFIFTEGPRWRVADSELLFTDVNDDTIYSLSPPSTVTTFRSPSGMANGLATDVNGDLIACEHGTRRVSRTDSIGTVTTVADSYLGMSLNSPNDVAVRSDGTIYFTDPPFGIPAVDQELPFNGVFRVSPLGVLTAEHEGALGERPNGVVLSPDESTLYVSDTALATVTAWTVAPDGSLSAPATFATGATIADGMCVDTAGNLYVATFDGVEVFARDGMQWGTIVVPRIPSNCGFGDVDGLTLYITAREGLYSVSMVIPGIY
jgi:gluconolactonase